MKKLTTTFLIVLMFSTCYSMTFQQIIDDIRMTIGDNSTSTDNQYWSDDIIKLRVNLVQEDICEKTLCYQTRLTSGTTLAIAEYPLPEDYICMVRVSYVISNSTPPAYKKLDWTSIDQLDRESNYWENLSSGTPTHYYERTDYFGIKPKPSLAQATTYAIRLDYYARASSMSATTDIPFDGNRALYPYHRLLVLGTAIMCVVDVGKDNAILKQEYYSLLDSMYKSIRNRPDMKVNFIPQVR